METVVKERRSGTGEGRRRSGGPKRHAIILANRLPWPLDDGWKVRTFHVVRGIAARTRVTLLVFHSEAGSHLVEAAAAALGANVRLITVPPPRAYTAGSVVRGLVSRYPVHIWNQDSRPMRRALETLLATDPPDLFVSESTFMARYLDLVPEGVPRIIDTHNVDSVTFSRYASALPAGPKKIYASLTARKLAAFEKQTYRDADAVWVCSDVERTIVSGLAPDTPVWVIPNGVDTEYFSPGNVTPIPDRILFFGRLDYYPNVDGLAYFVREVMPILEARRPGVHLHVVGSGARREVEALIAADRAVTLVGHVPDLRQSLREASVVIVPLRVGGGTRLKILEALSMAKPVVSTAIGAEGIDVVSGEHLLLAEAPDAFADAVADLLDHPDRAAALGLGGRGRIRDHYDWSGVGARVGESLEHLAGPGRG